MVSEKKPFTPADDEKLMVPQTHAERLVLSETNVFDHLKSHGYDNSKLVKRNDNYHFPIFEKLDFMSPWVSAPKNLLYFIFLFLLCFSFWHTAKEIKIRL